MQVLIGNEENLDPEYFSLRAWLARQTDRNDDVGGVARARRDGAPNDAFGAIMFAKVRAEYDEWYRQAYPRSAAARAASERLAALEATRTVQGGLLPVDPGAAPLALATAALADVEEILGELVGHIRSERQQLIAPRLRRLSDTVDRLRSTLEAG